MSPPPVSGRFSTLRQAATRLGSDAGSVAITAALMFPVVVGGIGLGIETGYWYLSQRKLQHIADVSVHAAALRKRAGDTKADYTAAAHHVAVRSGYKGAPANISVVSPPPAGPFAGRTNAVEVVATEPLSRYFTVIFTRTAVTTRARAVATVRGRPACVLALSGTASGAVKIGGSTSINLPTCDIVSNSTAADSVSMGGAAAHVSAGCVMSSGGIADNGQITVNQCSGLVTSSPPLADPYKDVVQPSLAGTCRNGAVSNTTLTPTESHPSGTPAIRFCNGFSPDGVVNLQPGLYIIEKSFTINNGVKLSGTGVTLFFASGADIKINGGATLNIAAPTSGPYSGIVMFGDRAATSATYKINGSSNSTYQGAVYFPSAALEFTGNSASTHGCTQLIAKTIEFTGNSNVGATCENAGTRDMSTAQVVTLVE